MELQELIDALETWPPDTPVLHGFARPHSYRGYYDQLAFEPEENTTAGAMLAAAREAMGSTYTGWKGGEYTMGQRTECHLATIGSTGQEITSASLALMMREHEVARLSGRRAWPADGDADPDTLEGKLRRLAWRVQQTTVGVAGGNEHAIARELLELAVTHAQAPAERDEARASLAEASRLWDGPETTEWLEGVRKEAAHQVARWGRSHDAAKEPEAFFWLIGYLAGKALAAARTGDTEKALHHTISTGAALLNWHARMSGGASQFQPGDAKARPPEIPEI